MGFHIFKKFSIFKIISNFFHRFEKVEYTDFLKKQSRFDKFVIDLNESDEGFLFAKKASILCDNALQIAKQRISLITKLQDLTLKAEEIESFSLLTPEEVSELRKLIDRHISLSKEKSSLRGQIIGFDQSLQHLFHLEDEAEAAIKEIKDAEHMQRLLKQDMAYLEGEKNDLEYEKNQLESGVQLMYKLSIIIVIVFAFVATGLVFSYAFGGMQIFLPTTVTILAAIFFGSVIYVFRRRFKYAIKLNVMKQARAVELLNKKKVVYVHYTNFLNYEYKKFRVRNAEMLTNNLGEFGLYKHLSGRYDSIRSIIYQTENEIELFLNQKRIKNLSPTIEKFAQTISIEDKRRYYQQIQSEKQVIENSLGVLDNQHEEIWNELIELNERDATKEAVIDKMMQFYLDEVSNLMIDIEDAVENQV